MCVKVHLASHYDGSGHVVHVGDVEISVMNAASIMADDCNVVLGPLLNRCLGRDFAFSLALAFSEVWALPLQE